MVSTQKYDVYGAVRASTGPSGTKHKFCGALGHPSEDETGLVYMRARYYDPVTGRFVNEDPLGFGRNWFAYGDNSPTQRYDFTGKMSLGEEEEAAAGAQELEGQGGSAETQALRYAEGKIANFSKAKWYSTDQLKKQIIKRFGGNDHTVGDAIHDLKDSFGMGGADNIGLDAWGGMWTKTGEFLGFVTDFL